MPVVVRAHSLQLSHFQSLVDEFLANIDWFRGEQASERETALSWEVREGRREGGREGGRVGRGRTEEQRKRDEEEETEEL